MACRVTEKVQRGQATIGLYDGVTPSLTCATSGGKVFIHTPGASGPVAAAGGEGSGSSSGLRYLNINRHITALAAGCLDPPATAGHGLLEGSARQGRSTKPRKDEGGSGRARPDQQQKGIDDSGSSGGVGSAGPAPGLQRDLLMVGTPSSLLCYDVHDNKDVFFKARACGGVVVGRSKGAIG
jgi:hypothetical protein